MAATCEICGKSKEGKLVNARLGLDEGSIFVICKCKETSKDEDEFLLEQLMNVRVVGAKIRPFERKGSSRIPGGSISVSGMKGGCQEVELRMSKELSQCCFEGLSKSTETEWEERGWAVTLRDDSSKEKIKFLSARLRLRRPGDNTIKVELQRRVLCPGVVMAKSHEYSLDADLERRLGVETHDRSSGYKERIRSRTKELGTWRVRSNFYTLTGMYSAEVESLREDPKESDILEALVYIHSFIGHVSFCSSLFEVRFLDACRRTILNVIDVPRAPQGELRFRIKADGETAWVIDGGSFWYVCRPDRKLTVTGWIAKRHLEEPIKNPDIVRVEQILDGRLVLIDVPVRNEVITSAISRYITSSPEFLGKVIDGLVVRSEFWTYEEAEAERARTSIPSDGVIAIDIRDSTTYRIKEPTLDMIAGEDKILRTMESTATNEVLRSKVIPFVDVNGVYECSLGREEKSKGIFIKSLSRRLDKTVPNSFEVGSEVLRRLTSDQVSDASLSRKISILSFAMRERVYSIAKNLSGGKSLIIDVGSGRLQSWSLLEGLDQKVLFCDPNFRFLSGRGVVREDFFDITRLSPKDRKTALARASARTHKGHKFLYFKGEIEELLKDEEIYQILKNNGATFVYSFSLSHVKETINSLARAGFSQVGCGFLYDRLKPNGELFNINGHSICLVKGEEKRGVVDFFGTQRFEEEAIGHTDFENSLTWYQSKDIVEKEISEISRDIEDVVKHLWIFVKRT